MSEEQQKLGGVELRPDLFTLRTLLVNLCFIGEPRSSSWVLIDTGLFHYAERISKLAEERFSSPPQAIILTHGHFDHVGSVQSLLKRWDVPVYAHPLELPYLQGKASYPPADPSVGGGLLSLLSALFPNEGLNLGDQVRALPADGTIPYLPQWQWIHTPGHTPGHISLFREQDRIVIAGDAFLTVKQESALAVLNQEKAIHGPPKYFTINWTEAMRSLQRIADLKPDLAITGHGHPMEGEELRLGLESLINNFSVEAIPEHERYVD